MSLWNTIKELFTGPRIQAQFEQLLLEEEARKNAEAPVVVEPVKEETVATKKKPAAKPAAAKPAKGAKAAAKPAEKTKAKKKK